MAGPKKAAKKAVPRSLREVGEKFGMSKQAVKKHLDKGSSPAIARQIQEADLRRKLADAERQERMLEVLDGEYLPREAVDEAQAQIAQVINALLRAILSEVPPLADGLEAAQIEEELGPWVEAWEGKLANAESNVWKAAKEAVIREAKGELKKVAAR